MKDALKKWSMHAVGSALSVLAIVSTIPTQLQLFGAHTAQIVGIAGLLITFFHGLQQQLGQKAAAAAVKAVMVLVVIGLVLPVLNACALLANPTFDAVLSAVIQAAVSAVLDKNPGAAPVLVADATTLAQLAAGSSTSATTLQSQADMVIAASALSIGDKQAIEDLIAAASDLLQQESAQIPAKAQSGLQLVFTDIANSAQLYVAAKSDGKIRAVITR